MSNVPSDSNQLSKQTTPTWEMELLISGATVFGLMQLPGPMSRVTALLMNSNDNIIASMISIVSIYLYGSLIALIGAFILHLVARGYWVALVGMHSVYPQGIKWDKNNSTGPIFRAVTQDHMSSMPQLIEQADNRATNIFGLGFGLAFSLAIPIVIAGSMLLILLVAQFFGADIALLNTVLWSILFIFVAPWFFAYLCDHYFGEKLQRTGKNGWLKSIFTAYQRVGFVNRNNVIVSLYTTNSSAKKIVFLALLIGALFLFAAVMAISSRDFSIDNGAFSGLPRIRSTDSAIIHTENYRNSRTEGQTLRLTPYIEDIVATENYLRLFIPYQPSKHNKLIRQQCPEAVSATAANNGAGMACLSKWFDISIDGKPVATNLLAAVDGDTQQRGMIAMLDIRKLAEGQHELSIMNVPDDLKAQEKRKVHHIPFWK